MSNKIERLFNFPQDIEWAFKDNIFYILQSRNITTISQSHNKLANKIDNDLDQFFYYKMSLSDSVPKIDKNTIKLLKKIYSNSGPIKSVYSKHHIN